MDGKRYIAIDAGKYNTKLNTYDAATGNQTLCKFRTKMSEGTFDDDMFEKGTFIVQVDDGPVYKVGRDGRNEPEMETSKKSEIHQVCALTAAALALGPGEHRGVNAAIGIPLQICNIPEERLSYKHFIFGDPGDLHTVRIKTDAAGPVLTSAFSFDRQLVYPEGIGVLYEYPSRLNGPTGIIDIGNLNTNNLYCDAFLINNEGCYTAEMGGKILIAGLSATLTSELGSRVDDNMAASTLLKPYEQRYLRSVKKNREIEIQSKNIIDRYLLEHVRQIKQRCDTRQWPLEFMNIVCMGGTARLLKNEIYQVFGEETFIPEAPEFVNVKGFLKKMCADDGIDLTQTLQAGGKSA